MIERAFRAARTTLVETDIVRILDDRVIVVANAFDSGFSTCWPLGSRIVLELFAERWDATHDLEAAFAHVRLEFPTRARTLVSIDDEDFDEPAASLLAASIDETHVDVVWIGPQHLVVVRDGVVAHRTQPDTLVEMGRAQGFDYADSPHKHVLTRTIRTGDILEPHSARFTRKKGDRVIVASEAIDDAIGGTTALEVLEKMPRDKFECVIFVA